MPLIGHAHIVEEFKGLADRRALSHGYLLHGPDGVGKRTFARSLAAYIETGEFTDTPERLLTDIQEVAPVPGERSLGIDAVREVARFLKERPLVAPYRTLILDGAEFLTAEAENALLKITEEPGPTSLILMIVTDPEELLPTLQSRVQHIPFMPLAVGEVEEWLATRGIAKASAKKIALQSFGRPGLAQRIAEHEPFGALLASAEKLLHGDPAKKKATIKELTDEEMFNFDEFLEALMIAAFPDMHGHVNFWHAVLGLRKENRRFALNPKLQLTALARVLESR